MYNCLRVLDGTHIHVNVPKDVRPRYKSEKSKITTNVLDVCSQDIQFICALFGREDLAHDGKCHKANPPRSTPCGDWLHPLTPT